jgi:SOS response regulatory protein OraA/RecX
VDFKLVSLKAYDKKRTKLKLTFENTEGEPFEYIVSEGTYRDIGCPLSGDFLPSELIRELVREDEEIRALKKALGILSYADNSCARLRMKLARAGFSKKASEEAVKNLIRMGLLDDNRQVKIRVEALWRSQLAGPRKIMAKLVSEGYSSSDVRAAIEELKSEETIDFSLSKRLLLEKKRPESYEDKQKLLYRYGYVYD